MKVGAIVSGIIGISVGAIVASAMLPTAITQLAGANTTGWDTATIAVWGLITISVALAVVLMFFRYVKV